MLDANGSKKNITFPSLGRRKIEGAFQGGNITSNGGMLLVRSIDKKLGLTKQLARCLKEYRDPNLVEHSLEQMLKQRVYGIALGYEDLNDHDSLRNDIVFQTAADKDKPLASSPTLSRFENNVADSKIMWDMHVAIVEQFIASFTTPPEELILDFDATDTLLHGNQEGKFYHGYYRNYCFLPLYVYCGQQLLVSYLRTSSKDQARHSWAILSLLVKRFRQQWPGVKIVFRGDSGFCRYQMFEWCDNNDVNYIIGLSTNKRLAKLVESVIEQAKRAYEQMGEKQRLFTQLSYAAQTWKQEHKVIGKIEYNEKNGESGKKTNLRFVITNLPGDPQELYEDVYCQRGNMENRIKETQLYLFADRTSCHKWWPNQLRLLFSAAAYILIERLRAGALKGTQFEHAQVNTIRLKLFKIGTLIIKNTRRIRFLFSYNYPYKKLFALVVARLAPG